MASVRWTALERFTWRPAVRHLGADEEKRLLDAVSHPLQRLYLVFGALRDIDQHVLARVQCGPSSDEASSGSAGTLILEDGRVRRRHGTGLVTTLSIGLLSRVGRAVL